MTARHDLDTSCASRAAGILTAMVLAGTACTNTGAQVELESETNSSGTETNSSETETSSTETETGGADPCTAALEGELGEALFACGFDSELRDSWAWVREQADAWTLAEGVLTIDSLPGTLWEGSNDTRNIAAVDAPPGDFIVELSVTGEVATGGEQGGLMWYAGDDDYLKFVREMVGATRSVVLVTETAGVVSIDGFAATDSNELDLQLERAGDTFIARYRVPGDPWQELVQVAPDFPGSPRIALFTQGDPEGQRSSSFFNFSLSSP